MVNVDEAAIVKNIVAMILPSINEMIKKAITKGLRKHAILQVEEESEAVHLSNVSDDSTLVESPSVDSQPPTPLSQFSQPDIHIKYVKVHPG